MTAFPIPSDFEARTNATYDALMWALSRPGLSRALPTAGAAAIVETLIDRECQVFCDDASLEQVARSVGAKIVAPAAADHLFYFGEPDVAVLASLQQGSDMYPEEGATLILTAKIGQGDKLKLTGPGVDGMAQVAVSEISSGFWAERARVMRYPMGFDLFLIDGDSVLGIPRSTTVEVL
jgi:alpha-D-ribose 1-methylphosphonate 5-triphosphate synthase subunit PhnH